MALHLIPDDNTPHAPTTECGCGVRVLRLARPDGTTRQAFAHGLGLTDVEADTLDRHVFQVRPDGPVWTEVDAG